MVQQKLMDSSDWHSLFDATYYITQNPDVGATGIDPLQHYLESGAKEGRSPHPFFDTQYYLDQNPDIDATGMNPLQHYLEYGSAAGQECSLIFSIAHYYQKHPEVRERHLNPLLHYLAQGDDPERFTYFPWRSSTCGLSDQTGHYNILVFSHDASRTGAPILLLSFLKTLKKLKGQEINLWIVLDQGGVLAEEFQACALTLEIPRMTHRNRSREDVLKELLQSFKRFTSSGMVLVNTATLSHVNEWCEQFDLPVLSWIHELPASVDLYCGGYGRFQYILRSSKKIIYASECVRKSLLAYAGEDDDFDQGVTLYYGATPIAAETVEMSDLRIDRSRVRSEFDLPSDAFVVLGCGTVTQRKGADLFVLLAHQVIKTRGHSDAFFIWIGEAPDPQFLYWLQRDIDLSALQRHVIFAGQREDPSQYMRGCDVFALTSREDPFPLVNLEAMYHATPVIAFQGAGGASEIYSADRGISVRYLDISQMAEAIIQLKNTPDLKYKIGLNAQYFVRQELTWEAFVHQFVKLLSETFAYPK